MRAQLVNQMVVSYNGAGDYIRHYFDSGMIEVNLTTPSPAVHFGVIQAGHPGTSGVVQAMVIHS